MPVKRWMPRESGCATPTSELQRSCSSPPPTSTAPTSVSSQQVLAEPVGLGVDGEELRGEQGLCGELVHEPLFLRLAPDAVHVRVQNEHTVWRGDRGTDLPDGSDSHCWAVAGCGGGGDYANKPRPPAPINVTAAITDSRVSVSPQRFGAGPIVLIISNQSSSAQKVIFETDELGGTEPGNKFDTTPINPRGTATLKVDVREGDWKLSTDDGGIRAAAVSVGRRAQVRPGRPPPAMSARRVVRVAGLAAVLAALWRRRAGVGAEDAGQTFFEQRLLADGQTSKAIKTLLRTGGGFVDRGVVFRDLTGDKRDDAFVRVHSGGAAGVVAVYVFSTANRKSGKLRAIFRSQSLMRASTRVLKGVASYRTSRYEPGDELCCPARLTQSTLEWNADERRMRVSERVTFVPPPEAGAGGAAAALELARGDGDGELAAVAHRPSARSRGRCARR